MKLKKRMIVMWDKKNDPRIVEIRNIDKFGKKPITLNGWYFCAIDEFLPATREQKKLYKQFLKDIGRETMPLNEIPTAEEVCEISISLDYPDCKDPRYTIEGSFGSEAPNLHTYMEKSLEDAIKVMKRMIDGEYGKLERKERSSQTSIKPPLGVMPLWAHNDGRLIELNKAIERYELDGREPLDKWIDEKESLEAYMRECFRKHHGELERSDGAESLSESDVDRKENSEPKDDQLYELLKDLECHHCNKNFKGSKKTIAEWHEYFPLLRPRTDDSAFKKVEESEYSTGDMMEFVYFAAKEILNRKLPRKTGEEMLQEWLKQR